MSTPYKHSEPDARILTTLERVATVCAWAALPIGLLVLLGYIFSLEPMTKLFMDTVFMSPNTALLICCLAVGLVLKIEYPHRSNNLIGNILIGVAGTFALAVLLEYVSGLDLGIDLLLFPALVTKLFSQLGVNHPGRFALTTAVCMLLLCGSALWFDERRERTRRLAQWLALSATVLCGFFLTAYLFAAEVPPALVKSFSIMAPHTALALLLLGGAVLFARPSAGAVALLASSSLGGVALRRLLPVALLFPVLLGILNLLGERVDLYQHAFGLTVIMGALTTLFGFVIWWTALQLDQLDNATRAQQSALQESEERYRNILETAHEGIWILDLKARTSYVNHRIQEMLGYSAEEMLGKPLYDFVDLTARPEAETNFERRVQGEVETYDFQFSRKDGSILWAIISSSPLKDSSGKFVGVLKMVADITERKLAEEELRRSQEALERAQAVAHIGSWEWDVVSNKLYWSDEMLRIYGLTREQFGGNYESYQTLHHPDDRERVEAVIQNAFDTCSSFHFEHRIIRPDGELRYLDGRGECIAGPEGQPVLLRGTGQDITERKLAELATLEAQQRFQSLLDNAAMPIYIKDLRGRYLVANKETAQMLAVDSVADVLGHTVAEFLPVDSAEVLAVSDAQVIRREEALTTEEVIPLKDGPHYTLTVKFPMRDAHGTVIGVGGISSDITERRRAERALRESEALNRTILSGALDAVISMATDDRITSWNGRAEELFGWTAEEAIGREVTMIIPERYREAHKQGMRHFLESGEAPVLGQVLQLEAVHRSGREFPIDLAIGRAATDASEVFFTAFIRDITERRRAEQELREQSEQLEQLNSEMQVALQELANSHQLLQDQAAALERSNADLDDFAYIASHDLKEPLRGISNYANFLAEDYADQLEGEGRQMLQTLPRLTKRLEALLDALLKYSRLNRAEIVPASTDLDAVLTDVQEMLEARITESNTELRIPRPLPTIMCDRTQTTEIFLNLISNGIKYNDEPVKLVEVGYDLVGPDGNVIADADLGSTHGKPRNYRFYVSDNGIGIAEKYHETVFGAFRRLHSRDKYGGGTGVGLAIVKKMVERQGGRIWIESEPGEGSTFYFTLSPETGLGGGVS